MAVERYLYIGEQIGPDRQPDGPQRKPRIDPEVVNPELTPIRGECEWAVEFLEHRYAADHGSTPDLRRLLSLLNWLYKRDDRA